MPHESRTCQHCGKPLLIRLGERPASFAERKTCSRACGLALAAKTKKATSSLLTPDMVRAIKWLLVDEVAVEEISKRTGVTVAMVKKIKAGIAYREIEI